MFSSLHVKNFILIDDLTINFKDKMTALTGETGAGKSLILDATKLLLGSRVKTPVVRTNADKAIIEGVFEKYNDEVKNLLIEYGIDDVEELIIKREIHSSGKSVARINGTLVTLSQLETLGNFLLDIHTQNDTKRLFDSRNYFDFIDDLSVKSELAVYKELRKKYLDAYKKHQDILEQIKNDTKQYEFNKFQYNELKNANLVVGEIEDIENELSYLNNFENISNLLNQIKSRLKHDNILDGIYDLTNDLNKMAEYDEKYSNYIEKLDSIYYELEDLGHNVTSDLNGLEYDEEKLNDLNERVVYLNSLKKKYHLSIEELIEYQTKLEKQIALVDNYDEYLEESKVELLKTFNLLKEKALAISSLRKSNAVKLTKDIIESLNDMLLNNVRFEIEFKTNNIFNEFDYQIFKPNGIDTIDFKISFNKGQKIESLKDVASGGEMSRIMLALKVHLIKNLNLSTIIFDEIDTGISRNAAYSVALKLNELSNNCQVIEITHLPIVASFADQHLFISKTVVDDLTKVEVEELSYEKRVNEIATMLSPTSANTDNVISLAKEMLENINK